MTTFRQFSTAGTVAKARRQRNSTVVATGNEKVDSAIAALSERISILESNARDSVTAVEVTLTVAASTNYPIKHNLNSAVRWYPIDWVGVGNTYSLNRVASQSDLNTLTLRSNTAGQVVVRIETSYGAMP